MHPLQEADTNFTTSFYRIEQLGNTAFSPQMNYDDPFYVAKQYLPNDERSKSPRSNYQSYLHRNRIKKLHKLAQ